MDINKLKKWVSSALQVQQVEKDATGMATQADIVDLLRPLYEARIAGGTKPRDAVEELEKELAKSGIETNLTVTMFKKRKSSGFDLGDKPPLRVVLWGWQSELRAMARRGWTDAELVEPVRGRIKKERPDLADVAEKEITEAIIHELIAKRRSRSKAFLPDGAPRPVTDLVMSWRRQIKRLSKRGWRKADIVAALQGKVREEYKDIDPAAITNDLVQRVLDSIKNNQQENNDTPSSLMTIEKTVAAQPTKAAPVKLENVQEWQEKNGIVILKDAIPVKAKTRIITESGKIAEVVSCKPAQYGSGFSKKDGMEVFYKITIE